MNKRGIQGWVVGLIIVVIVLILSIGLIMIGQGKLDDFANFFRNFGRLG